MGRRQEPTASPTSAPRKRFRPIKVIFSKEGNKKRVMKNYWAKKVDLQFGISNDCTRFKSMRYTKLKEKLNELKDKGEDDWCIRRLQLVKKVTT